MTIDTRHVPRPNLSERLPLCLCCFYFASSTNEIRQKAQCEKNQNPEDRESRYMPNRYILEMILMVSSII
jgi:hypothetical protein